MQLIHDVRRRSVRLPLKIHPATPFGGSKGAPFWVWGPPGFPFRTCTVLRQVLNIVHLDVICMLYIIYIYVYNIHLYFTWWFRIIAAPKVLNVGCDYQAQLIRGGAEASPASHGSGPSSSWFLSDFTSSESYFIKWLWINTYKYHS